MPAELDELYRRMVAKRPEDRFPTMAEVVHALESVKGAVPLSDARGPLHCGPCGRISPTAVTMAVDPIGPMGSSDFGLNVSLSDVGDAPTPSDVCGCPT